MIFHKIGDTWSRVGTADFRNLVDKSKADLTGWTILSQIRTADDANTLIADFECEWVDPVAQTFTHKCVDTKLWPEGLAQFDIQFTSPNGEVTSTDTALVTVARDDSTRSPA